MTTEYRLEKKVLAGWQTVSWWSDNELDKATNAFNSCSQGDTGYSWRLIKIEVMQEKRLEEEIPIEPKNLIEDKKFIEKGVPSRPTWGNPMDDNSMRIATPSGHGLVGSVWMVHYGLKKKTRISASEYDKYVAEGYVKGGPRTVV